MKPALSLSGGQTGGWPDGLPAWQQTGRQTEIMRIMKVVGCKLSVGPELVSGFNVVINSFNAVVIKDL